MRVVSLMNEWRSVHPSAILNYIPHRAERRALALFLCGDFPLARIDANCEKRNCLHCVQLASPIHALDSEEHMISDCPRFTKQRGKSINALDDEDRVALSSQPSERKFRFLLTSSNPKLWRRFAWMLARILALRRKAWEQYNQAHRQEACQRQKLRNRAPRKTKIVNSKKPVPAEI